MTGAEYAAIAGVIFLAACLQASTGFGMGMLAAPVVAMVDPTLLPATLILLALLVTILVTVRERQHLDLRGTGWALVGRIPGSILGACLVAPLSKEGLAWVVVVVVLGGYLASRFMNRFLNAARLRLLALGASAVGSLLLTGQLALAALQP